MASSCSNLLRTAATRRLFTPRLQPLTAQTRLGHTVRVIITEDLKNGHDYAGDVLNVRAGFARNHLIPGKKALYATPQNFEKLGMADPDLVIETKEERSARLSREAADEEGGKEAKAADFIRYYLRNKTLKIWRNVDSNNTVHPGMVDHKSVRDKLSKQLKIDLDDTETIHLRSEPVPSHDTMAQKDINALVEEIEGGKEECKVQIREIGYFLAQITLPGDHIIPLKIEVKKR